MPTTPAELVAGLTLEQKSALTNGDGFWYTAAIESAGLPRIMMTDGPHGLRKQSGDADQLGIGNSVPATCAAHGIRQKFIKPHCPWQNGKVERLNRTLATEWAYRQPFTSNQARRDALAPWLEHYNNRRRHTALGGHPPINRLTPTS